MIIERVSASQISGFVDCERKWYHRYVDKVRFPSTVAQERGSGIHKAIEHYLLTGKILDNEWKKFVIAAQPFLPTPGGTVDFLVERKFLMPTFEGGPQYIGFIDLLVDQDPEPPLLRDFKTTSDFRYCKTPKEMEEDVQLVAYAKWLMREQDLQKESPSPIKASLLYLHTRRVNVQTNLVETELTRWQVDAIWERDMRRVRRMMAVAEIGCVDDVPPTTASCKKYGGCEYQGLCGLGPLSGISKTNISKRSSNMSSFLDKLKAAVPASAPVAGATPPEVASGVVPPDAADNTTPIPPPETATIAATEPPKTRGRKKLTDAEKAFNKIEKMREKLAEAEAAAAEPPATEPATEPPVAPPATEPAPAPAPAPVAVAPATTGFALFIDCIPVKGNQGQMVLFDDWIAGVIADINETVDVADYRLLKYQEEKMALQTGIEKHIATVPPVLVVRDSGVGKDALTTLIPHAMVVTRAIR